MPEQITKYPDITLQVLKEAGARCGEGASQKILKQCPAERFCALPSGEMCVYGLNQIPQMTQVTPAEIAKVVCPNTAGTGGWWDAGSAAAFLAAGLIVGAWCRRTARVRPPGA